MVEDLGTGTTPLGRIRHTVRASYDKLLPSTRMCFGKNERDSNWFDDANQFKKLSYPFVNWMTAKMSMGKTRTLPTGNMKPPQPLILMIVFIWKSCVLLMSNVRYINRLVRREESNPLSLCRTSHTRHSGFVQQSTSTTNEHQNKSKHLNRKEGEQQMYEVLNQEPPPLETTNRSSGQLLIECDLHWFDEANWLKELSRAFVNWMVAKFLPKQIRIDGNSC